PSHRFSLGTEGMRYSLLNLDVIADTIETIAGAETLVALLKIGGCVKKNPSGIIAISRSEVPALFGYGRTIRRGKLDGEDSDLVSVFEGVGKNNAGEISDEQLHRIECHACPGAGSCGGMYTANTMASAVEALGMSLPGNASKP